jgi:hypothetical protein
LSWAATWSSSASLCTDKSLPFGKYWRSRPLVFSLLPRCQGLCGSQKKISMSAAIATCFQSRISGPWSQVNDRRTTSGRVWIFAASAGATLLGLVPVGQVHQHHRVPGRAFDQGADRGQVALADDQVALPVPGHPGRRLRPAAR